MHFSADTTMLTPLEEDSALLPVYSCLFKALKRIAKAHRVPKENLATFMHDLSQEISKAKIQAEIALAELKVRVEWGLHT